MTDPAITLRIEDAFEVPHEQGWNLHVEAVSNVHQGFVKPSAFGSMLVDPVEERTLSAKGSPG